MNKSEVDIIKDAAKLLLPICKSHNLNEAVLKLRSEIASLVIVEAYGNVSEAARRIGTERNTITKLLDTDNLRVNYGKSGNGASRLKPNVRLHKPATTGSDFD